MPNHIINEITLHGVGLDKCAAKIFNAEGVVDFSVLVPLPLNFWAGSVGVEEQRAFPGNHLDAAREMWGTKWNAYDHRLAREEDGSAILTFETAWSPPRGWICAVFNTFDCEITAKWLDEGAGDANEERYYLDKPPFGRTWETKKLAEGSDEHRRLYVLLWGHAPEEHEDEAALHDPSRL